ncbi:unnamed protein product, partial [Polarella glacialis]
VWNRSSARVLLASLPQPALRDGFERLARWPERQKDFFMYAVLGFLGGIFVDADVVPLRSPEAWLRDGLKSVGGRAENVRLMVGVECSGSEEEAKAWRWSGRTQLTAWAAAAAPGHPVLMRALDRYLSTPGPSAGHRAQEHYQHSVAMGPGLLTSCVDEWLRELQISTKVGLEGLDSVRGRAQAALLADTLVP